MIDSYRKQILAQDIIIKLRLKQNKIPHLSKINIHLSSKNILFDERFLLPSLVNSLILTGRSSYQTRATKSIANFGLRKDQLLGYKIDLRRQYMENFLRNIVFIALTRDRQFMLFSTALTANREANTCSKRSVNGVAIRFFIKDLLQFFELEEHFTLFKDFRSFEMTLNFINPYREANRGAINIQTLHLILTGLQLPVRHAK